MADCQEILLGVGTGAPAPKVPPGSPAEMPPTWTPACQWCLAVSMVFFLGFLAFRGWGLSRWSTRPIPIQRNVVPLAPIDLNTADVVALRTVPGLGDATAQRIIEHRQKHGAFRSIDDLRQVKGIGPATLEKVREYLQVAAYTEPGPSPIVRAARPDPPASSSTGSTKRKPPDEPIDVNHAPKGELMRLPGIGPILADRILDYRRQQSFRTVDELRKVKGIGVKTLEKIRPHVRIGKP